MCMPQRVRRQLMKFSAFYIDSILPVKSGFPNVALENLSKSVLGVVQVGSTGWMKQITIRFLDLIVPLADPTFSLQ